MLARLSSRKWSACAALSRRAFTVQSRRFTDNNEPLTELIRDFLEPAEFFNLLHEHGLDFFTGVPDSLLKDFCAYVTEHSPPEKHVIAANEGAAVGLAAGYHMATGKVPIVYMQNSGYGNAVNPILSLADPKVYSIPMLFLIGWRGEPGKKDEPQHRVQGKVMTQMLASMNVPFEVLPDYIEGARETIATAENFLKTRKGPYALLVKRQTFSRYRMKPGLESVYSMSREAALREIVDVANDWDAVVATTGFTSRELFELRDERHEGHEKDFLTVGSMGHSAAIAMGIAVAKPSRQVLCVDGDGSLLMHMGTLATVGKHKPANYKHILINNGVHDSVGGQPTGAFDIDFPTIARACGYDNVAMATTPEELRTEFTRIQQLPGPSFLEVRVHKGARKNLGRPTSAPLQNKAEFMRFLTH